MVKPNCWEVKNCGRQPGGPKAKELGVCAASTEKRLAGTNGGINAGRCCWALTGTLCGGKVQGTFAQKVANCLACDFYKAVAKEEGKALLSTKEVLALLK